MKPYAEPLEHTDLTLELVPIPGGTFMMGSPDSEDDRNDDEGPQHEVKISPFWMGKYEVTWDQYDAWGEGIDQLRRVALSLKQTPRDLVVDGLKAVGRTRVPVELSAALGARMQQAPRLRADLTDAVPRLGLHPREARLLASATLASARLSPSPLVFDALPPSARSTRTAELLNDGPDALSVERVELASPGAFAVRGGSCVPGAQVHAGERCTVEVEFTAPQSGPSSDTLSLAGDFAGSPLTLPVQAAASLAPTPRQPPDDSTSSGP